MDSLLGFFAGFDNLLELGSFVALVGGKVTGVFRWIGVTTDLLRSLIG